MMSFWFVYGAWMTSFGPIWRGIATWMTSFLVRVWHGIGTWMTSLGPIWRGIGACDDVILGLEPLLVWSCMASFWCVDDVIWLYLARDWRVWWRHLRVDRPFLVLFFFYLGTIGCGIGAWGPRWHRLARVCRNMVGLDHVHEVCVITCLANHLASDHVLGAWFSGHS